MTSFFLLWFRNSWTRTKTSWEVLNQTGPGPNKLGNLRAERTRAKNFEQSRTDSGQDQEKFENFGSNRTRPSKIKKISDRAGPGSTKFGKSWTKSDRSVPGPDVPWIPGSDFSLNTTITGCTGVLKIIEVVINYKSDWSQVSCHQLQCCWKCSVVEITNQVEAI